MLPSGKVVDFVWHERRCACVSVCVCVHSITMTLLRYFNAFDYVILVYRSQCDCMQPSSSVWLEIEISLLMVCMAYAQICAYLNECSWKANSATWKCYPLIIIYDGHWEADSSSCQMMEHVDDTLTAAADGDDNFQRKFNIMRSPRDALRTFSRPEITPCAREWKSVVFLVLCVNSMTLEADGSFAF